MTSPSGPGAPLQYGLSGQPGQGPFYKHSGAVTLHGAGLAGAVGIVAAIVLGSIYAYADLYIPIIYLNLLLSAGFGAGVGAIAALVMRWGKVRNVPVALAIVGVLTVAAYFVSWVVWICAVLDRFSDQPRPFSQVDLALHPGMLLRTILAINEIGTWSMGHSYSSTSSGKENVSGVMLWLAWAGEAVLIFGASLKVTQWLVSDLPFCERCQAWCTPALDVARFGPAARPEMLRRMVAHDFDWLYSLGRPQAGRWVSISHQACLTCGELHTLTVKDASRTVDKKGREKKAEKVVANKLLVTAAEVERVKALAQAIQQPAQA